MSQNINERSIENKKFFKTNNLNAMDSIGITNNGTKYWGKKREKKKHPVILDLFLIIFRSHFFIVIYEYVFTVL